MSGITPLLDTLLHQVLGKRADVPTPRALNAPVQPISPEDALQALKSDSRLEPQRQAPLTEQAGIPKSAPPPSGNSASGMPQSSAQVHFSASAQAIAQALTGLQEPFREQSFRQQALQAHRPGEHRFLGKASVLALSRPLLERDTPLASQRLAQQLQASIRDSGLFFEAHLVRWFHGELSRKQLEREPQMQRQEPATTPPTGAAVSSTAEAEDPLLGIVRHQLEMLALPVLRWEGEAWSGLFMALTILPPPESREAGAEPEEGKSQTEEEESSWHSELSLTLENLGRLEVKLRLDTRGVDLTLSAEDPSVVRQLSESQSALRSRLQGSGVGEVSLRIVEQASPNDSETGRSV